MHFSNPNDLKEAKLESVQPFTNSLTGATHYYNKYYYKNDTIFNFEQDYQTGVLATIKNQRRYRQIRTMIRSIQRASLLDVGCGIGGFLAHLKKQGMANLHGLDFDEAGLKYGKEKLGLRNLTRGELLKSRFDGGSFDCVTMWHYLEHTSDPGREIETAKKILKPGGILAIGVPNHQSIVARIFGTFWAQLHIPFHINQFTPKTLKSMLETHGFEVIKSDFLPTAEDIPYSIYLWWTGKGREDFARFLTQRKNYLLIALLNAFSWPLAWIFSACQHASFLDVYAKKSEKEYDRKSQATKTSIGTDETSSRDGVR